MPRFFVPGVSREEAELVYARLAISCGCEVPVHGDRIYQIQWTHESDVWVATVGQRLRGRRMRVRRRGGDYVEISDALHDPAMVRAIFPGPSYIVMTDARRLGPFVSYWNNPFMAGKPSIVVRFTV